MFNWCWKGSSSATALTGLNPQQIEMGSCVAELRGPSGHKQTNIATDMLAGWHHDWRIGQTLYHYETSLKN